MTMKNDINKFITDVKVGFQNNKGKGSLYCFSNEVIPNLINEILINYHIKNPTKNILIVVDTYNTRIKLLDYFKKNIENFEDEYNIKVLSITYILTKYKYLYDLIITIGVNDDFELINHLNTGCRFMLTILTQNLMNNEFIINVRKILPSINANINTNIIEKARIYSPVKEIQIPVTLNDDDRALYNKCTEFINTSVKIFGDIGVIEKCKNGDRILNISSAEFRHNLAIANGWSENLDVNIEFQKQIDDIYNPNVLFERANTFYNITRQRRDLVTDNNSKLEAIANICNNHPNEQILIVSKRGEFASKVTEYLNKNTNCKCGDYHDCIEECIATDMLGEVILIKSGENKGKPKIIGSQAISSRNEMYYANGLINCLSIKNSSNKKLKLRCSIVIFTSPTCDNIFDFKNRFSNVEIDTNPAITYKIYCENTIEENILLKEKPNKLIEIINDNKNFVRYDEISGDIIL